MRQIERLGHSFSVDDEQPTFWDRFAAGNWEPETLEVLDRVLMPHSTFVDIGAWVGPTSLWAAHTARRVIAVEADPAALGQLAGNLAVNPDLERRIEIIPRALHPIPGEVALGARRKPGDSMSSVLFADGNQTWNTETITPRELADRVSMDDDIVFKMDIEGGEYALLPAMEPLIQRARAALVSFHHELALKAFNWTPAQLAATETELSGLFAFFQRLAVGDTTMSRATVEWLFLRP